MTSFRLRPRFSYHTDKSPEEVQKLLSAHLDTDTDCIGKMVKGHIILSISEKLSHYWSPQLNLNLEKEDDGSCTIDGLYTPKPSVWSIFIFGYGVLGVLFLFMGIIAGSSYMLGEHSWTMYALPFIILAAIALYVISQVGQKVGAEQMFTLHHFLEDAIHEKIHNLH